MKAKGLEALASAAAGSPQATPVHQEVVKEAESATATGEATATSTSNLSSGINLNNLTPQQQQQIMQLMKSQSSNSTNPMNNAHNNNAASALLGGLQSMSQTNTNPLLALQQQLASQQLLQLLFNRQPATTGNPTQQTTTMSNNSASSFLDSQNAQKLQALLSGIQAHSKLGESLLWCLHGARIRDTRCNATLSLALPLMVTARHLSVSLDAWTSCRSPHLKLRDATSVAVTEIAADREGFG